MVHEQYDGVALKMDYALLELKEDIVEFAESNGKEVGLACLNQDLDLDQLHGEACWIAGWGTTKSGSGALISENPDQYADPTFEGAFTEKLKSAGVNVFSKAYCMAHTVKKFWHPDTYQPEEICVGTPDNDDADDWTQPGNNMCKGDSGGPLICPIGGKATLVGITSK